MAPSDKAPLAVPVVLNFSRDTRPLDLADDALLFVRLDALEEASVAACWICSQNAPLLWCRDPLHPGIQHETRSGMTFCHAEEIRFLQMRTVGWEIP